MTRGKPGVFQVIIMKTFDTEKPPHLVDTFIPSLNQTRLSLKSDWEVMRDFFNESFSGHKFTVTKTETVDGNTQTTVNPVSPWSFAQHQVQKYYPGFYNMSWGCKGTLCARFLAALNFKDLFCCRFIICSCPKKVDEFGVSPGWICCLHLAEICCIIHSDRWGKSDVLIVGMEREDEK